jgi:hypothetical protein
VTKRVCAHGVLLLPWQDCRLLVGQRPLSDLLAVPARPHLRAHRRRERSPLTTTPTPHSKSSSLPRRPAGSPPHTAARSAQIQRAHARQRACARPYARVSQVLPLMRQYNASGFLAGHDHCLGHYDGTGSEVGMAFVLAGAGKECCCTRKLERGRRTSLRLICHKSRCSRLSVCLQPSPPWRLPRGRFARPLEQR